MSGLAQNRSHTARRRMAVGLAAALVMALMSLVAPTTPRAEAALMGLPPGFVEDTVVSGGLPFPTTIAFTPGGKLFIALKSGIVRVWENGALVPAPFVDISAIVHDNHDRGLLGLAIHPKFPQQPYVYLLYTHDPPGVVPDAGDVPPFARVSQLLRVEADPATGYRTAKPGSRKVLVGVNSTRANIGLETNGENTAFASCMTGKTMAGTPVEDCIASDENSHSVGSLAFGPDDSLYVSSGDASNFGGVDHRSLRAQMLDSLNGKVLRINPITGAGLPDNPFYDAANPNRNRSKVWAYGLRNPFRLTVNPVTGEAYIGDVGWNTWEEIDIGKGANFGWPCYEGGVLGGTEGGVTTSLQNGPFRTNSTTSAACGALYAKGESAVKAPVYSYAHLGLGAAANAGAVYNGTSYPAKYKGALFIADYNKRWIKTLTFDSAGRATASTFGQDNGSTGPVQLLIGPDSNLYWLRYGGNGVGGEVRRIRYVGAGNTPPVAAVSANPMIGQAPLPVTFSSAGSFDPDAQPLSYSWNFGDGATSTEQNPRHTYTRSGVYTATLTLAETTAPFARTSEEIRITVGTNPPLATITAPPDGTTYAIGDKIKFSGRGSAAGKPIPASGLSWEVRQGHNQHFHYFTPNSAPSPTDPNVREMTLIPDDHGDMSYYQVCLTATVSADVHDTNCIDLEPRTTTYTVATQPAGLTVQYEDEGLSLLGPSTIRPIVKSTQTLSVDTVQQHRSFTRWSDGVTTPSRTFVVGTSPVTFTAVFDNKVPQARITATPLTGLAPLTVSANASASSDPEGDTLKYSWTNGQGAVSTVVNPQFVYGAPGTYKLGLTVTDQLGGTNSTSVNVVVTGTAGGWASWSIGAATNPGSTNFTTPTTVRISNAGPGITGVADAFRYVSQSRTGNFTFIARVDSMTNTNAYAKAGLMVRELFSPTSRHVMLAQTATTTDGTKMIRRGITAADTVNVNWSRSTLPPRWLKLVRVGSTFTGSQSVDGQSWTVVGSTSLALPATVHVGLAVASQAPPSLLTAQFSNVSLK